MDAVTIIVLAFFGLCVISSIIVLACVVLSGNTSTNEHGEFLTEEEIAELEYAPMQHEVFWKE